MKRVLAIVIVGCMMSASAFAEDDSIKKEIPTKVDTTTNQATEKPATEKSEELHAPVDHAEVQTKTSPSEVQSEEGFFGPVSFGPSVGLALPHPINLGIEGRFERYLGFAVNYGFLPQVSFSDAKLKLNSFDARVRVFPFAGAFFVGAAVGRQSITASTTVTNSGTTTGIAVDVNTTFITPTLGWRWGGRQGFVFGVDLGWQIAASSSSVVSLSNSNPTVEASADFQKSKADAEKVGKDVGQTGLPNLTMIHIGYLF